MKKLLALTLVVALGGCQATGAYQSAATANSIALETAVLKVCSALSTVAAERSWTKDQLAARELFCSEMNGSN